MTMKFDERDRGGLKQRYTRIRNVEFIGSKKLEHREGGAYPLHVVEERPGVFISAWMIDAVHCHEFFRQIKADGNTVTLSLVVDTNVPGHPTVSMQLQETFVEKD